MNDNPAFLQALSLENSMFSKDLINVKRNNLIFKNEEQKGHEDDDEEGSPEEEEEDEEEEDEDEDSVMNDFANSDDEEEDEQYQYADSESNDKEHSSTEPKERIYENSESPDKPENGESKIEKFAKEAKLNEIEKKLEELTTKDSVHVKNGIEEKENIELIGDSNEWCFLLTDILRAFSTNSETYKVVKSH